MNSKKISMMAATAAVLMMLCVAVTPIVADSASAADADSSSAFADDVEKTLTDISKEDFLKELKEYLNIDDDINDFGDLTDFDIPSDFAEKSGLDTIALSLMARIALGNEFGDVVTVDEVKTFKSGETLDLVGDLARVNLKFTENGKYVVEKGASVLLCESLKLEGKGAIIELKEGSLIKFTKTAEGYPVDKDTVISLNGTFSSSASYDEKNVTADVDVALNGTLSDGRYITIENDGNMIDFSLSITANSGTKIGTKLTESPLDIELAVKIKSVIIGGVTISGVNVTATLYYDPVKGAVGGEIQAKATTAAKDITTDVTLDTKLNIKGIDTVINSGKDTAVSADAKKEAKIEFDMDSKFSVAVKGKDTDTSADVKSTVTGSITDDKLTLTADCEISDFKLKDIEAKGVKAHLVANADLKSASDSEPSDILDMVDSASYAEAEYVKVKTDESNFELSDAKVTFEKDRDNATAVVLKVGKLNMLEKNNGSEWTTVGLTDGSFKVTEKGEKVIISGKDLVAKTKPVLGKEVNITANNFTAEKAGKKVTFVSGTFNISDISIGGIDTVISKNANVTGTMTVLNGKLTVEDGNKNLGGKFVVCPGATYVYNTDKTIDVDRDSLGKLVVSNASGVQTLSIEALGPGYILKESDDGLKYTVDADGKGTFADAAPSGTLSADCGHKTFKLTINGETTEKEFLSLVSFPEGPAAEKGKVFLGWTDGYVTCQPNQLGYLMPARDVTFTAVWGEQAVVDQTTAEKYSVFCNTAKSLIIKADTMKDMIEKVKANKGMAFDIKATDYTISFNGEAASAFDGELTVSITKAEKGTVDDEIANAIEDGALYSIDVKCDGEYVNTFATDGKATVTVTYDLKDGQKVSDLKAYYFDGNSLEPVVSKVTDLGNGKAEVTMTLEHFSDYIVKEDKNADAAPAESTSNDDNGMSVGVIAGAVVAVIVILAIVGVVLTKRKG